MPCISLDLILPVRSPRHESVPAGFRNAAGAGAATVLLQSRQGFWVPSPAPATARACSWQCCPGGGFLNADGRLRRKNLLLGCLVKLLCPSPPGARQKIHPPVFSRTQGDERIHLTACTLSPGHRHCSLALGGPVNGHNLELHMAGTTRGVRTVHGHQYQPALHAQELRPQLRLWEPCLSRPS